MELTHINENGEAVKFSFGDEIPEFHDGVFATANHVFVVGLGDNCVWQRNRLIQFVFASVFAVVNKAHLVADKLDCVFAVGNVQVVKNKLARADVQRREILRVEEIVSACARDSENRGELVCVEDGGKRVVFCGCENVFVHGIFLSFIRRVAWYVARKKSKGKRKPFAEQVAQALGVPKPFVL